MWLGTLWRGFLTACQQPTCHPLPRRPADRTGPHAWLPTQLQLHRAQRHRRVRRRVLHHYAERQVLAGHRPVEACRQRRADVHRISPQHILARHVEPPITHGLDALHHVAERTSDVHVRARVIRNQARVVPAPGPDHHVVRQTGDLWSFTRARAEQRARSQQSNYGTVHGCHLASFSSGCTMSPAARPAASPAKLITSRCVSTVGATERRSSSSAIGRPSSAARALAPKTRYCDARWPAPQDTYSFMKAGAWGSGGRVIRTSVTAARTNACDTGIRRTKCCIASTSSAVSAGRT